ncbi:MAG: ABC transporter ATP-binding protein [Candidatus Rokuibacteriota bacterium]
MAPLLALAAVSKRFGSLRVIEDLSLSVEPREALGVIGPNGAGKTTALNLMIGRLRPDRGAVLFAERDVTGVAPHARCRAGIALTHQIPHPFEALTVFENVLVGAVYGGGHREGAARAPCLDALELTGLSAKANTRAARLTLLERKRLELARALATGPRVLLLDEIAGGLSEREVHELVQVIRRVQAEGVAIVWIEHIVHALRAVVTRLAVIGGGRLLREGPPDAVMADPEVQRVYLGIDV